MRKASAAPSRRTERDSEQSPSKTEDKPGSDREYRTGNQKDGGDHINDNEDYNAPCPQAAHPFIECRQPLVDRKSPNRRREA